MSNTGWPAHAERQLDSIVIRIDRLRASKIKDKEEQIAKLDKDIAALKKEYGSRAIKGVMKFGFSKDHYVKQREKLLIELSEAKKKGDETMMKDVKLKLNILEKQKDSNVHKLS